jgi:hypothetical protein
VEVVDRDDANSEFVQSWSKFLRQVGRAAQPELFGQRFLEAIDTARRTVDDSHDVAEFVRKQPEKGAQAAAALCQHRDCGASILLRQCHDALESVAEWTVDDLVIRSQELQREFLGDSLFGDAFAFYIALDFAPQQYRDHLAARFETRHHTDGEL